jgi:hypothetical protein
MSKAKKIAEGLADYYLDHSHVRKSFRIAGGRDEMVKQFMGAAEQIAALDKRIDEQGTTLKVFTSRWEIPDTVPEDWQ